MEKCRVKLWPFLFLTIVMTSCSSIFPYRVMNNNCACEHYVVADKQANIDYAFTATYFVDEGINTRIEVEIGNNTNDTLDLSLGTVKVASRNVPYRYNGKFLPITISSVAPGQHQTLTLVSEPVLVKTNDPWLRLAGEELIFTVKGLRIRGRELRAQVVRFVPQNPKLRT
jgi:hypothetical protein